MVLNANIKLSPCAFLHNYPLRENDPILDPQYQSYIEDAPVFARGDAFKLREFIKKVVKTGDNKEILYGIGFQVERMILMFMISQLVILP